MHTHHAGCAYDNRVTLTFDLLTSGHSVHAERLPFIVCLPSLVFYRSGRFPFGVRTHRRTHTHTKIQTQVITLPMAVWHLY